MLTLFDQEHVWNIERNNIRLAALEEGIMQNKTHLKWLKNFVGDEIPLFSIVVFSERCELKKVTVWSEDGKVIKRDRVYATVRAYWENNPDVVSDEKIEELYRMLKPLTHVDNAVKAAHIDNIERKYKNSENIVETKLEDVLEGTMTCPRCGNKLVLRVAKKGENTGKYFYGCSGFPKCRFIHNSITS